MTKTTLAYYNPNPSKHEDVADCTVRAYCKAFDTTWENALLVSTMSALKNHRVFNDNKAIQEFLKKKMLKRRGNNDSYLFDTII